jgi:hypothetical protein
MSLSRLLNQPLQLQKVGSTTTDVYGDQIPDTSVAPINIVGFLEQVLSIEHLVDRDTTVTSWRAFFPAGTNIARLDRIINGAQTFQVDGDPWLVYNPRTKVVAFISCKLVITDA